MAKKQKATIKLNLQIKDSKEEGKLEIKANVKLNGKRQELVQLLYNTALKDDGLRMVLMDTAYLIAKQEFQSK